MRRQLMILATAGLIAPVAGAGMIWDEAIDGGGDAGDMLNTAQVITAGPLTAITGSTTAGTDEQDLYCIQITNVSMFSAITDGSTNYDTQLWLFDANGILVTGNDDDTDESPHQFGSALLPGPNDNGTPGLIQPGTYYLAVSGFGTPGNGGPGDPVDGAAMPLANQPSFDEHTGPDGAGGGNPLGGWIPGGDAGDYTILITGVPAPGALALLGLAGCIVRPRRRRG